MNDEFEIQVNIGGKVRKIRCKRSDEQFYRVAVRQINDKLLQYQSAYGTAKGLEENDLLTMVALHFSLSSVKTERNEDIGPVFEKLEELNSNLVEFVRGNE